ncbi:ATP-binding cassette subfamily B protein [Phenylobacterium haematophilum]|uniref:ATP-binding cassette subfamily B protein n=1 Tax=Phenylobacterium haematophilum TaxID=98513 RepID=A0A839ZYM5_9CAUL|nr:ABC transporter ATP-binding protein [Phenylobacterium haematophilum]MBB3891248.1 ATP-binding cassette subfamily B protein [Phenylobacterium haematophilum]
MTDILDDDLDRPRTLTNRQVLGFMAGHWMREPKKFALIIGFGLVATVCDLSIPWATRGLINAVSSPEKVTDAAWIAWASLSGLYLVFYMSRTSMFRVMNGFYARIMSRMVKEGFARVQAFSSDWHASNFAGATVRRVSRAMWGYDSAADALIAMLLPTVLVLGGLAISLGLRWPLAGLFVAVVIGVFAAYNILMSVHFVRPANLRSTALDSEIGAALADAIGANPTVKSFGAEDREAERFAQTADAWRWAVNKTWDRFNVVGLGQNVLLIILQAGLTGFLVHAWAQGQATPGDVAFAITSFIVMAGYMRNFSEITQMLQKGLDDMLDVATYMRTEPQLNDDAQARPFRGDLGEVIFDRVTFGYANQPRPLYEGFTLIVAPGERIALVGPTGAGKSTFVKLIQRLYDVQGGRILIDGQDISKVSQTSLRRAIAVVPQDPALFHRSIAENIAYARPDATADEVMLAAKRARAHDFIARLPNGYETPVGERGVKLSGGERQRVAIARAFLADAPILVLDEATSSLDVETERQVQAAMEELMVGRTTIVIAHRLSTIRGADRILVFDRGRIVEEGRHAELIDKGGFYARLHAVTEGTEL